MKRIVILVLLGGCAKQGPPMASYAEYDEAGADYGDVAGAPAMEMAKKSTAPAPKPRVISPGPASPATVSVAPEAPADPGPVERMVHYEGYAQLRVSKPDETADAITALATGMGGYVETLGTGRVSIRVPVARFQEAFDKVLALGQVVQKSISAEDVTEAFAAVELRLKIARSTRDRLVFLLSKAKDEQEKILLLRQIQSVTEQIDTLEAQGRLYAQLADFSRITVAIEVRPTLAYAAGADGAAFTWIRSLTPFADQLSGKKVLLPVPTGFVALDEKRRFVAESADGARVWTDRIRNEPVGTASFWMDAVKTRVAQDFRAAEVSTTGAWTRLRLVSLAGPSYTWVILLKVDGAWLDVAQVYYPTEANEERHHAAVDAVFGGGAS